MYVKGKFCKREKLKIPFIRNSFNNHSAKRTGHRYLLTYSQTLKNNFVCWPSMWHKYEIRFFVLTGIVSVICKKML